MATAFECGKNRERSGTYNEITIDTAFCPLYNTATLLCDRLLTSRLTDQGVAYEEDNRFLLLNASHGDMPPSSPAFFV
jgi:hypothetical protein